jgi:hypothetical protein
MVSDFADGMICTKPTAQGMFVLAALMDARSGQSDLLNVIR